MTINDTLAERGGAKALLAALETLVPQTTQAPWHVCQHLKSVEADAACSCGYRGVVFGPDEDVAYAVMQPGHEKPRREEEWGSEPPSYPRPQQIADMQLVALLRNNLPAIMAALRGGWQTIETAPKDGSYFLIWRDDPWGHETTHVAQWDDDYWQIHDGKSWHMLRGVEPTHWMPLAPPPDERGGTGEQG
jgi:hypothetical protein